MSVFDRTGGIRPGHSLFNLSYNKKFDCDMGQLIPIMCDECLPGDRWKIGNSLVIRFNPLFAPILHEINAYVHYFFVPYRLMWPKNDQRDDVSTDGWETFYTGGLDGTVTPALPFVRIEGGKGKFSDFGLGLPPTPSAGSNKHFINAFPFSAYRFVWNEYYRDENLQPSLPYILQAGDCTPHIGTDTNFAGGVDNILYRDWEKDYFTSALPWQQRGDAPALPVVGQGNLDFASAAYGVLGYTPTGSTTGFPNAVSVNGGISGVAGRSAVQIITPLDNGNGLGANAPVNELADFINNGLVVNVTGSSVDISDLRLAVQMQKWMERSARAGYRYTEALREHFSTSPSDSRLQRPEYLGGSKYPIIISEVLQTGSSDDTSPQGNMAGHGISANGSFCASYHVQEWGLILGLLSVMPRTAYQNRSDRQWRRRSKWDYYSVEFAHLSEQPIEPDEIYTVGASGADFPPESTTPFGFQGRYDELRTKMDMVCNNFRDIFDYWHLGRQFASAPQLNADFVTTGGSNPIRKDIFASTDTPGLLVNFHNSLKVYRPMPAMSDPGLVDHF